jgi:hypothetical protein
MTEIPRQAQIGDCVAGRYRIEEIIGRGGMATVYRALDQQTGQSCALKRGLAADGRKAKRRGALLEREYHTLAQLAHPSIIEVYEYGVDAQGPFYTMELLAGNDLDSGGRLPWKEACALLYDVASSLAILHARGLLHRDLSLRNVRCTPEGRAKLIDFGAMTPMGVSKDLQGTAPFISPEVLQMQELDARADLFSLGAVGYYLLTGRYAYPARRISELRDVWRSRPVPPGRLTPEMPAPLNALILQLLTLDRGARPRSAAEVMERLCVIAGLPMEEHVEVSRAYLATPALVGREPALVRARREILSLVRREGGTLLIDAASGCGRSRMLDACVLEGKLLGMPVLRADAGDAAEGDWGVARALCSQLGALAPDIAAEAWRLSRDVLEHVLDGLGPDAPVTTVQPERSLLLRELRDYMLSFARNKQLLFVVDDVDKIDEPSAALLAAVANKAKRSSVLLILALEREHGPSMSAPLRLLRLVGGTLELEPLTPAETQALLQSIFGDVPHLQLVAARVHGLAQGNPRATMDIAQHLVERGLARYAAGSWLLPSRLDERDLPATLAEALVARLSALGPDAHALLEVQAVADGEALDVGAYSELARIDDHKRIFTALDELVAARVFSLDGDGYRFSQRGFVPLVLARLGDEPRQELHSRIADRLRHDGADVQRRADHLLRSNRAREAIELLSGIDLHANLPPVSLLERAIEQAEQHGSPARTLHQLRGALVSKASLVLAVESFRRHLPHLLARLDRESGLALYRELSDLPPAERLQQALTRTQQTYLATPEEDRVSGPLDAIRELVRSSGAVCAFAAQLYDLDLLESLPNLSPLETLSPALAIVNQLVTATQHWIAGRQQLHYAISERILERIAQPDSGGLEQAQYRRMRLGLIYGLGLAEAGMGSDRAEARAALLEQDREYRVNAWRLRMVMHLKQGNLDEANRCERRSELLYLQEHGEQSFGSMGAGAEVSARGEADDLLGVKSSVETLASLAERYPHWRAVYLGGLSRLRAMQGDMDGALSEVVSAVECAPVGRHNAFGLLAALHVHLLGILGRVEQAIALGRQYLETCEREQLGIALSGLRMRLAEVLAAGGHHDEAVAMIDAVIATGEQLGRAGLALGSLYESRARIAIRMRDSEAFDRAAHRCAEEYQKARNPALSAKFARLLDDARQEHVAEDEAAEEYRELLASPAAESEYNTVHSRMLECVDTGDRARCALSLMLQSTESSAGYLFGVRDRHAVLLAALPDLLVDADMCDWVDDCLQTALDADELVTAESLGVSETQSSGILRYTDTEGHDLDPVFLIATRDQQSEIAAVLVLRLPAGSRSASSRMNVPVGLMRELARELLEHGDVGGMPIEAALS